MSEMALTTGEKGKGKGIKDPAEAGGSVATKREAAEAAGRKGPTNGVTEGSSGSCRRYAQREKQPGQRLTHSLSSEISDSGNERNKQKKSGVTPDVKQTKQTKGEKERRKLLKDSGRTESCHARWVRRVRRERKGKREGGVIS